MLPEVFGGPDGFEAHGKEDYRLHYDKVRALASKERLLEYRVGEGWERLCDFQGVPVPEGEFPRANESKEVGERMELICQRAIWRTVLENVLPVLGVVAVVGLGYHWPDDGYWVFPSFWE